MTEMIKELILNMSAEGDIFRTEDNKHIAHVNQETGAIKYSNAAYAKGAYKESIMALASGQPATEETPITKEESPVLPESENREALNDPRIPVASPERHASLGGFSPAHINYDHANLSDEDFAKKYKESAVCQLEFLADKPDLFADLANLENRFAELNA